MHTSAPNPQCFVSFPGSDGTHLKEQLLRSLGAVAEVDRADVVASPARCSVELQQIGRVRQNGVQGVDAHAPGDQQQIDGGIRR